MKFLAVLLMASAWAQDAPSFVNEGVVDAPIAEVWKVGLHRRANEASGPALAQVDLRVGGLIRTRYSADGVLGEEETIENLILAYEPGRMKPPKTFPFRDAWAKAGRSFAWRAWGSDRMRNP